MPKRKRRLWHPTPYDGQPGFFNAWLRFFYQFEGTADLGDPNEPPYVPPADPRCPVCAQPMKDHRIDRGGPGKPTHLSCPPAIPADHDAPPASSAGSEEPRDAARSSS
ncbi:hypothetical protein [Leucobacter edaphi]|uniref:hypothetical protein n=1 Tax=Leucobacter edaphi TaxID=2796472 RepID=UPI001F1BAF36|nr:hypothetical protein [Leucobacter edaphi]